MPRLTGVALILSLALAVPAWAKPPLRDVPEIDDRLFAVALAVEISDRCATIAPRTLKGLAYLWRLADRAKELGYTSEEIDAYRSSDAEKARIRRKGEAYMRAQGLDPARDADLCRLGQSEMAKNTLTGSFLKPD